MGRVMGGPWVPGGTQWSQWSSGIKGASCGCDYDEGLVKHDSMQNDQGESLGL